MGMDRYAILLIFNLNVALQLCNVTQHMRGVTLQPRMLTLPVIGSWY